MVRPAWSPACAAVTISHCSYDKPSRTDADISEIRAICGSTIRLIRGIRDYPPMSTSRRAARNGAGDGAPGRPRFVLGARTVAAA
jgi:hypothetical protein